MRQPKEKEQDACTLTSQLLALLVSKRLTLGHLYLALA